MGNSGKSRQILLGILKSYGKAESKSCGSEELGFLVARLSQRNEPSFAELSVSRFMRYSKIENCGRS